MNFFWKFRILLVVILLFLLLIIGASVLQTRRAYQEVNSIRYDRQELYYALHTNMLLNKQVKELSIYLAGVGGDSIQIINNLKDRTHVALQQWLSTRKEKSTVMEGIDPEITSWLKNLQERVINLNKKISRVIELKNNGREQEAVKKYNNDIAVEYRRQISPFLRRLMEREKQHLLSDYRQLLISVSARLWRGKAVERVETIRELIDLIDYLHTVSYNQVSRYRVLVNYYLTGEQFYRYQYEALEDRFSRWKNTPPKLNRETTASLAGKIALKERMDEIFKLENEITDSAETIFFDEFSRDPGGMSEELSRLLGPLRETSSSDIYQFSEIEGDYYKKIENDVFWYTLQILALIFGLGGAIFVLAPRWLGLIMAGVERLKNGNKAVGEGRLDVRLNWGYDDEIGDLVSSFNTMAGDLQEVTVSRDELQNIFSSISEALFMIDCAGKIQRINSSGCDLLGYERSEIEGRDMNTVFASPENIPDWLRDICNLTGDKKLENRDTYLQTKNGENIPVLFSGRVLTDKKGSPTGVVCVAGDLRPVKEARRQAEKFRRMLDQAKDSIFIVHPVSGEILDVNFTACGQYGYPREGLISMGIEKIEVLEDGLESITEIIGEIPTDETFIFESKHSRRDGTTFPVEVSGSVIETENQRAMVAVVRDISRRRDREEKLRRSERRFRMLADNLKDGLWISNPDKQDFVYVSPAYLNIWGFELEELKASPLAWLERIHPDDRKRVETKVYSQEDEEYSEEFRIILPDNEQRWVHDRAFSVKNDKGEVYRIVGITEDITEQKELQLQARRSEKLAALGKMAAGLMHEINNPNAFISGNLEYIARAWPEIENRLEAKRNEDEQLDTIMAEIPGALEAAKKGGERIKSIVNNVKIFARGGDISQLHRLSLEELTTEIRDLADSLLDKEIDFNLIVETDRPAEEIIVRGEIEAFHQIISNLLENAMDALKNTSEQQIKVRLSQEQDHLEVTIKDNGPGIPTEKINNIFQPFYTDKPTGEGTGLGLSIVHGLIKQLNWEIDVNSRTGGPTTFLITIPIV